MNKKILHLLILLTSLPTLLHPIPAPRKPYLDTLPDNTTIKIFKHGDERFHWITDENNNPIQKDSTGFYIKLPKLSQNDINKKRQASRYSKKSNRTASTASPIMTPPNVLIILVAFKDVAFKTPLDTIINMFSGDNFCRQYSYYYPVDDSTITANACGSAKQYFIDASMGQYNPNFIIAGPYTLSQNRKYYGENNATGEDTNPEEMIVEACQLAYDNDNINFAQFDSDSDNDVDVVIVLYAGYGEADAPATRTTRNYIWPHQFTLDEKYYRTHADKKFNDKRINRYACFNELSYYSKTYAGIGTFCHEFSHVLGLPDLYPTTDNDYVWKTMGNWDIMDHGNYNNDGNTPPSYSGYERFFMGWTTPSILNNNNPIQIPELQESNQVFLASPNQTHNLIGNNPSPKQFYILENRQQKNWDTFLPGHGLLLTKIIYSFARWYDNTVNNYQNSMGVDIIEADKSAPQMSDGKPTDAFPTGGTTYSDNQLNLFINNVAEENQIIYLNYTTSNMTTTTPSNTKCFKILQNNQITIIRNGKKYSLLGKQL